ncbi:hypothetical protein [Nocardia africana]|uniref:hypothetical protein n=1 Tax=Nocardia africana TaxID=134964 RepID=UPI000FE2682E|nr:hypothetical protein [Nocardia africana]MCC3316425.1 hypothetical protein [Nocardia africana]
MTDSALPWSSAGIIADHLARVVRRSSNHPLTDIYYSCLAGTDVPDSRWAGPVHEVDMSLHLVLSSGDAISLTWTMDGLNEGLDLSITNELPPQSEAEQLIDVSRFDAWSAHLGDTIDSIQPVWHTPNIGCPDAVWSYRFDFHSSPSVTASLGQEIDGKVSYLPDSIVVIFDPNLSASYHIPASKQSASGL